MDEVAELRAEIHRLRAEVRRITDRAEIIDVLNLRQAAGDARDWATLRRLFTPDVAVDHTAARDRERGYDEVWTGVDDVMARVSKGIERHLVTHHLTSNHRIYVRGDEATAAYVSISVQADPSKDGPPTVLIQQGWYVTELVRTAEGWRIRRTRPNIWKSVQVPIPEPISAEDLDARRRELCATYAEPSPQPVGA